MKKFRPIVELSAVNFGPKVIISDPCYSRGTWCAGEANIKPGEWLPVVKQVDDLGIRISNLMVTRIGSKVISVERAPFEVGVDSGQAGIFCDSIYPLTKEDRGDFDDEDTFYGKASKASSGENYGEVQKYFRYQEEIRFNTVFLNIYASVPVEDLTESETLFMKTSQEKINFAKSQLDKGYPENIQAGVFEGGVCSSSGFGDGGYSCYFGYDENKEVVQIEIVFIGEDDEGVVYE